MNKRSLDDMTNEQYLSLKDDLRTWMENGFKEIQGQITALIGKDISRIDMELIRHNKQHEEHYKFEREVTKELNESIKSLDSSITNSRISTIQEISTANKSQDENTKTEIEKLRNNQIKIQEELKEMEGIAKGKKATTAIILSIISASIAIINIIIKAVGG